MFLSALTETSPDGCAQSDTDVFSDTMDKVENKPHLLGKNEAIDLSFLLTPPCPYNHDFSRFMLFFGLKFDQIFSLAQLCADSDALSFLIVLG